MLDEDEPIGESPTATNGGDYPKQRLVSPAITPSHGPSSLGRKAKPCEEVCLKWTIWVMIIAEFTSLLVCVVIPWKPFSTALGLTAAVVSLSLLYLTVRAYRIANSVESFAPLDWTPPGATPEQLQQAIEAATSDTSDKYDRKRRALEHYSRLRYCVHCKAFKPPRAHHCRDCGRCVLKLDHHCLPAGTLISLPSGLSVPIETVLDSQPLQSFDSAISSVAYGGVSLGSAFQVHPEPQTCCRVALMDGTSLVCTPDHPVLALSLSHPSLLALKEAHYVHSGDLTSQDYVVCSSLYCVHDQESDMPIAEKEGGAEVEAETMMMMPGIYDLTKDRTSALPFARVAGAYLANFGRSSLFFQSQLDADQALLDLKILSRSSESLRLSSSLIALFASIGCEPSAILSVPKNVRKWPVCCLREFLAALLAKISVVNGEELSFQFPLESIESVAWIKQYLESRYQISTEVQKSDSYMKLLLKDSSLVTFITRIGIRYNAQTLTKLDAIRRWKLSQMKMSLDDFKLNILHVSNNPVPKDQEVSSCALVQVKEVSYESEKKLVYDLTVPHTHNFVAEGCVTHNCPWMTGCVAYFNHKAFVLFLFYAIVGMTVCGALHITELVLMSHSTNPVSVFRVILMVASLAFIAPFALGLLPLLMSQIYSVCVNETTMEDYIHSRIRQYNHDFKNPYDLGIIRNWKAFFGPDPKKWLWPEAPPHTPESGLFYPTREDLQPRGGDKV